MEWFTIVRGLTLYCLDFVASCASHTLEPILLIRTTSWGVPSGKPRP